MGLVRLRKVSGPEAQRQPELRGRCSIVRELHVYGTAVAVHARDSSKFQHQVGAACERGAYQGVLALAAAVLLLIFASKHTHPTDTGPPSHPPRHAPGPPHPLDPPTLVCSCPAPASACRATARC